MFKFFKKYAWAFILGFILSYKGWSVFTWQFYCITTPLIFLIVWSKPGCTHKDEVNDGNNIKAK